MKLEFTVSENLEKYLKDKTAPYEQYLPELFEKDETLAWELYDVLGKRNYLHNTEGNLVLKPMLCLGDWRHTGNLRIKGDCIVEGNLYVSGDLFVDGNLICKDLYVSGFTVVTENVNAKGSIIFEKDTHILRNLRSEKSCVIVKGDLTVYGSIEARMDIEVKGELKCHEDLINCVKLNVDGDITVRRVIEVGEHIVCQGNIRSGHRISAGRTIVCKNIESGDIKTGLKVKKNLLFEQGYLECDRKPNNLVYGVYTPSPKSQA